MNISWIILLLILFKGNNNCDCKSSCKCGCGKCNCKCCNTTKKCGCDEPDSPFPIFNGTGIAAPGTCGCDS